MLASIARRLALGTLLGCALGCSAAYAQLAVEPSALSAAVPQGETATRTVTLTNTGSKALAFCLNFDRPLQRAEGLARLSDSALGSACGAYGEVLLSIDRSGLPGCCASPYGLTMTPDGRLFAAESHTDLTYELDAALGYVRMFEHPMVAELEPFPATTGLTYNPDTETLWWLNIESGGSAVYRALLLEGELDGTPTGRRVELPIGAPDVPPDGRALPVGLAYDAARGRFYYTDIRSETIWAVDTLGLVAAGYPVTLEVYPDISLGFGLDAHSTNEDAVGIRFEVGTNIPGLPRVRRIVTAGGFGEDPAPAPAEPLVTPLNLPLAGTEDGGMGGEPVRSRLDPNGVLFFPWGDFDNSGLVAVRPHPLPPSWLVVEAWDGTLPPGESRTIELTFRPGARAVGDYTAVLQAFTAATGEAVEIPLTLEVTPGTVSEEEGAEPEVSSLEVYPNPSVGLATVALTLDAASETRVVVYDVLGRQVATLYAGDLSAGAHRFAFDAAGLPSGLYLVRVEGDGVRLSRRVTLVR